jgi:hypothetical protein
MRAASASIEARAAKESGASSARLVWPLPLACGFLIFVTGASIYLAITAQTTGALSTGL